MDIRKTRQQQQQQQQQQYGRLKGATRILSEHSSITSGTEEQPNKQEANVVDPTSTSNLNSDRMAIDSPTDTTSNIQQAIPTAGMLYIGSSSDLNSASSSSYNIQSSSNTTTLAPTAISSTASTITTTSTATAPVVAATSISCNQQQNQHHHHHHQQQQHQLLKSPQILPCDIKSLFECPICFDYAVPPIYQCQNGHLVCQVCSNKITHCPTCRVPITEPSIRNLQLDRLASTFQFPCKYDFNGCQWKSYWFKKREHEENCDYISYSCPCPGTACKWTGLLTQVMPHLSEHHRSITTLSGEDIVFLATDINLKGAVDWVMIQSCFNHHFLLVLEKQELKTGQQQFFAIVQLIGSQKEAENFKYKLELSSNLAGQVKRLQWEATARSILDGIQIAISNHDCLVFDSRMAQHFLSPIKKDRASDYNNSLNNANDGQGENLGINVTIERVI